METHAIEPFATAVATAPDSTTADEVAQIAAEQRLSTEVRELWAVHTDTQPEPARSVNDSLPQEVAPAADLDGDAL
jgi:hypothetical protein